MRLTRNAFISWRALSAHRVRTILAVGSVSVGVAAITVTGAIGAGARAAVNDRLQRLGTNLVIVRPAQVVPSPVRPAVRGFVTTLTLDDLRQSLASVPSKRSRRASRNGCAHGQDE